MEALLPNFLLSGVNVDLIRLFIKIKENGSTFTKFSFAILKLKIGL